MLEHIKIPKVEKVKLVNRFAGKQSTLGTLYITTSHLIFVGDSSEIWVLHNLIDTVERGQIAVDGCLLTVRCKHFLTLPLVFARDRECQDVYETLLYFSQPVNIEDVYAFSYVPANDSARRQDGWLFDVRDEYARMGVPNERWTLSDVNVHYAFCDTYSEHLVVPTSSSKKMLVASSKFRSRGRLPVLTYLHAANGACICRCAQPLVGFTARCEEDEQLMAAICSANTQCNVLYLIDTRPKVNTMMNRAQGKGTESEKHYANLRHHSFDIENIHVMRTSLNKLVEVAHKSGPISAHLSGVDASGWLRHVRTILDCSRFLAESVRQGISCVVHCSDGWDRTAQTCALSQLLLDPYYRTFDGFRALIEKDWLAFGHKFSDRCGHAGLPSTDADLSLLEQATGGTKEQKEVSPVFTQFIDGVYQLQLQYPCAFEYNSRFLLDVHEQVYACQFGTFLGNCEKDRNDLRLSQRTHSVWPYLRRRRAMYINAHYERADHVLTPDVRMQTIRLWRGMYNRWDTCLHPNAVIADAAAATSQHNCILGVHLKYLRKTADHMRSQLTTNGDSTHHCNENVEERTNAVTSVALVWQTSAVECGSCRRKFGRGDAKLHCYKCGQINCEQCVRGVESMHVGSREHTAALNDFGEYLESIAPIAHVCTACTKRAVAAVNSALTKLTL